MDAEGAVRAAGATGGVRFRPTRVLEVELSEPLPEIEAGPGRLGTDYGSAQVLVRNHGAPLGVLVVDLTHGTLSPTDLATAIENQLGQVVPSRHTDDPTAGTATRAATLGPDTPLMSVVVATFHRPVMLTDCIDSILASDHPRFEVLVVDNSPDDPRTRTRVRARYGDDPRVRYLAEARPGTSAARNAGLRSALGELIAVTDDDVVVDPGWLRNLAASLLADDGIACVTGLTLPFELETEPQQWFEQYGGMGGGFERREFDAVMSDRPSLLFPFTPAVGASNNMAIRRSVAAGLGGFDIRLGPGTPTVGGEDLDLFVRLLLDGHRIVYEPGCVVWHRHRVDETDLHEHVFGYGVGSVAVLTKWFLRRPELRARLVRHARGLPAAFGPRADTGSAHRPTLPPRSLARAQLLGGLVGPLRWLRSASRERRAA